MRFIVLNAENKVIAEREGPSIAVGEVQSDIGEMGQIMKPDGTFVTPEHVLESQPYIPNNAEIAQMISDLQADLIIAGVI